MTEVQLLGYVLQNGEVSSSDVAKKYSVRIDHAYQVLRRLEQKGLLERDTRDYGAKFKLTHKARRISQDVKENDGSLGALVFLGLAFVILLSAALGTDESGGDNEKNRYSLF